MVAAQHWVSEVRDLPDEALALVRVDDEDDIEEVVEAKDVIVTTTVKRDDRHRRRKRRGRGRSHCRRGGLRDGRDPTPLSSS